MSKIIRSGSLEGICQLNGKRIVMTNATKLCKEEDLSAPIDVNKPMQITRLQSSNTCVTKKDSPQISRRTDWNNKTKSANDTIVSNKKIFSEHVNNDIFKSSINQSENTSKEIKNKVTQTNTGLSLIPTLKPENNSSINKIKTDTRCPSSMKGKTDSKTENQTSLDCSKCNQMTGLEQLDLIINKSINNQKKRESESNTVREAQPKSQVKTPIFQQSQSAVLKENTKAAKPIANDLQKMNSNAKTDEKLSSELNKKQSDIQMHPNILTTKSSRQSPLKIQQSLDSPAVIPKTPTTDLNSNIPKFITDTALQSSSRSQSENQELDYKTRKKITETTIDEKPPKTSSPPKPKLLRLSSNENLTPVQNKTTMSKTESNFELSKSNELSRTNKLENNKIFEKHLLYDLNQEQDSNKMQNISHHNSSKKLEDQTKSIKLPNSQSIENLNNYHSDFITAKVTFCLIFKIKILQILTELIS